MSVDGTDFRINNPSPFWKGWYSHKFNGEGVRYEVGLCIQTGDIVWIHGQYPCGKWSDIKKFRDGMKGKLGMGERVEADDGYRVEIKYVDLPCHGYGSDRWLRIKKNVSARHEHVNARFKCFNILKNTFNYNLSKHGDVFRSVAVVTQLSIQNGNPLDQVKY